MKHRPTAKIVNHSGGLGVPSTDLVQRRAEEIARIDGRAHANDADWLQAKAELHGGHSSDDEEPNVIMLRSLSGGDLIAGSVGHHFTNHGFENGDSLGEELIAEGMEEAVHEQMLQAREAEPGEA
jgi:hypothetical protein